MLIDYNVVCNVADRVNGAYVSEAKTVDLCNFILEPHIMEARSSRVFYFWNKKGEGMDIMSSRIDKAFDNCAWIPKYSEVIVKYLAARISYHAPLLFSLKANNTDGGKRFVFLIS